MSKDTSETVEFLVHDNAGMFKIRIPASWKITFGALQPGQKAYGYDAGNVLRIYESETKQRAVFTGVRSFRDLSIPVVRRVVAKQSKAEAKSDGKGNHEAQEQVAVAETWEVVKDE